MSDIFNRHKINNSDPIEEDEKKSWRIYRAMQDDAEIDSDPKADHFSVNEHPDEFSDFDEDEDFNLFDPDVYDDSPD